MPVINALDYEEATQSKCFRLIQCHKYIREIVLVLYKVGEQIIRDGIKILQLSSVTVFPEK